MVRCDDVADRDVPGRRVRTPDGDGACREKTRRHTNFPYVNKNKLTGSRIFFKPRARVAVHPVEPHRRRDGRAPIGRRHVIRSATFRLVQPRRVRHQRLARCVERRHHGCAEGDAPWGTHGIPRGHLEVVGSGWSVIGWYYLVGISVFGYWGMVGRLFGGRRDAYLARGAGVSGPPHEPKLTDPHEA